MQELLRMVRDKNGREIPVFQNRGPRGDEPRTSTQREAALQQLIERTFGR